MTTQTSIDSYLIMQSSGKVNANQRIILDLLEQYPQGLTNNEISRLLNWGINRITPRVNELEKKGKIFRGRLKVDVYTHMSNVVWVACMYKQFYLVAGFSEDHLTPTNSEPSEKLFNNITGDTK